jgi:hypothetical protein
MFGQGNFTPMMGELKLNSPRNPFLGLGQAPAAPAPSTPVPGPAGTLPAVPAPAVVPVPTDSGMSHGTQVLLAGGVVVAALLSAVILSD